MKLGPNPKLTVLPTSLATKFIFPAANAAAVHTHHPDPRGDVLRDASLQRGTHDAHDALRQRRQRRSQGVRNRPRTNAAPLQKRERTGDFLTKNVRQQAMSLSIESDFLIWRGLAK